MHQVSGVAVVEGLDAERIADVEVAAAEAASALRAQVQNEVA